jgi:hypothetical protein
MSILIMDEHDKHPTPRPVTRLRRGVLLAALTALLCTLAYDLLNSRYRWPACGHEAARKTARKTSGCYPTACYEPGTRIVAFLVEREFKCREE